MKTSLDYIRLLLLSSGGMLVACSVLIVMTERSDGALVGKQSWFLFSMVWFAVCVLFCVISRKGKIAFHFSVPDLVVLLSIVYILVTYSWRDNAAPDKLMVMLLVFMLWFLLRISLSNYPFLHVFFIFILIYTGLIEALWGIGQGIFLFENDSAERLTGSFYEREAYTGYLALVLPLCLSLVLRYRNNVKRKWWNVRSVLFYISLVTFILILVALSVGAGRMAWVAVVVSCAWVAWKELSWKMKLMRIWRSNRGVSRPVLVLVPVIAVLVVLSIYLIDNKELEARVDIWQATSSAIRENPLTGIGLGQFPDVYVRYSGALQHPEIQHQTAGLPLYAFNEYLQVMIEHGVAGFLLFVILLFSCVYKAFKNGQSGVLGGLLSVAVLSMSSYPLQLPSFLIAFVFLLAICLVDRNPVVTKQNAVNRLYEISVGGNPLRSISFMFLSVIIATGMYGVFIYHKKGYNYFFQWNSGTIRQHQSIVPKMGHYSSFLGDNAQYLSNINLYEESNILLERAILYSNNPLLYTLMAKNYFALGMYDKAEKYLIIVAGLMPEKISTYYLLAKLYARPEYYHPEKMRRMALTVLSRKQLFPYLSNKDMKREMEQLLESTQSR